MKRVAFFIAIYGLIVSAYSQAPLIPSDFEKIIIPDAIDISPAQLSKDGLKLYAVIRDAEGPGLYELTRKKTKKPFKKMNRLDVRTGKKIVDFFQPAFSADGGILVFSGQEMDESSWNSNELYMAKWMNSYYGDVRPLDEINREGYADAYPWLSGDGLRLYYIMDEYIYNTSRLSIEDRFEESEKLNLPENTNEGIASCWLNASETEIYLIKGSLIYKSSRIDKDANFEIPEIFIDDLKDLDFISGLSFTADLKQMVIYYSGDHTEIRLYRLWK